MSAPIKQIFGIGIVAALALALTACAQGTGGTSDDDDDDDVDARRIDAQVIDGPPGVIDARIIDASLPVDARIIDASLPIDASTGGTVPTGGACTMTSQCSAIANCCDTLGDHICVLGIEALGVCVPLN